jgi:hypothetical protein
MDNRGSNQYTLRKLSLGYANYSFKMLFYCLHGSFILISSCGIGVIFYSSKQFVGNLEKVL